jgi:predicted GH43/DUF377 family glycosyl hydrolase
MKRHGIDMKRHGIVASPSGDLGATFNPAAIEVENGRYIMLVRSIPKGYSKTGPNNQFDDNYSSHLSLWEGTSPDNFKLVTPEAIKPDQPYDCFGAEDPRITKIGDTWYITYTALSIGMGQPDIKDGVRIALASTKDFKTFKKHGVIGPDRCSKAGVLFESENKVHFMWKDDDWGILERTMLSPAPDDFENPEAWNDLWSKTDFQHDQFLAPQDNNYEDMGIEPGAPPIEIDEGLLVVYSSISSDYKWTISLLLLDKNDPHKIISKTDSPVLAPQSDYELKGDVNNVVFPCGALIDNDRLYVYYGAADTISAVASESMSEVRKALKPFHDSPAPTDRSPV